jgi:hypothetical protein
MKKTFGLMGICFCLTSCSDPPKPQIPSLTPEVANQLLNYDPRAETWMKHAKKQDPSCAYDLLLPDQSSHPADLDFSHIVKCGGRPSPLELDASVSFEYDKNAQHWAITRFSD